MQVFANMISAKLKFDLSNSNILKRHRNQKHMLGTSAMKHRNLKSLSPTNEN